MPHALPISSSLISWGLQVTKPLLIISLQCPVSFCLSGLNLLSLHNLYFTEYSQRDQAKEDEMIWECSMHSSNTLSVRNFLGGRDSVAHMVTRIWSGRSGVRTRVAERCSERVWDSHPASCSTNTGVLSRVKRLVRELYHLSSSSAEIQNLWSYSSTLRPRPQWMDRDSFTFCSEF
jgi:hypothetical protein